MIWILKSATTSRAGVMRMAPEGAGATAVGDRPPPLVAVCFFPAGLAALSMVSSPKERSIMVSLTVPIAFLVGGGSPNLIGFFRDVSFFGPGIALVGGLIFAGTIFSGHLKFHDQNL